MLKKLFGQKSVPSEVGTSEQKLEGSRWVKGYQLMLTNMEETPIYDLTHQITVGSEIGNIVISDSSISPRHATFTLKEEVVSVVDHGSATGTYVNTNAIPAGKIVILEEGDIVRVGDLEIKLLVSNHSLTDDEVPSLPNNIPGIADTSQVDIQKRPKPAAASPAPAEKTETPATAPAPITRTRKVITPAKATGKKHEQVLAAHSKESANALVRIAAMIGDFLLAFAILILFLPFDEFKTFLSDIPQVLGDLAGINWPHLWTEFSTEFSGPAELISDLARFITSSIEIVPLFITYALIRIVSTLLFGKTISQAVLGIRSSGNPVWKRVGGALRVILGFVTWPFLVFDFPALISRRTFKEKITFTHLTVPYKSIPFIGAIIYFPLLVMLILVAPFFAGLEIHEPIPISTKIDERVVAAEDAPAEKSAEAPATAEGQAPAETPVATKITTSSQHLGLTLSYETSELSVFPFFRFVGDRNKLKAQGDALFVMRDNEDWSAELTLLKSFDLRQLLGLGIQGNFFLYDRYPQIYDFVYTATDATAYFKTKKDEKSREAFAKEYIDLIKTAFELSQDNLFHTMQVRSPFIKSFVDFRSSFLELIEYKDYRSIDFAKIGNTIFMRVAYQKQRPFDLLIPLVPGKGRIYKLTFDKDHEKDHSSFANKIYKYALYQSDWSPEKSNYLGETLTPFQVIDALTLDFKTQKLSSDRAQALYGFFYEKSAEVLKRGSEVEIGLWRTSVDSVLKMIKAIPVSAEAGAEDPMQKLLQNFQDIKSALENKNLEFFGVSAIQSV